MNLTIDVGNTRAKLAAWRGTELAAQCVTDGGTLAGLAEFAARHGCRRGILSSTVDLGHQAEEALAALPFAVMRLRGDTPVPLVRNLYSTPATLGSDRLAAVVGAASLCPGHALLVIDCGTCLTVDVVNEAGEYLGGNISPGLEMRLRAMHAFTGRLPLVGREGSAPPIGHDTPTAIRSGARRGMELEIEGYIRHLEHKYRPLSVFLTGGDGFHFDNSIKNRTFADGNLVARGLNIILEHYR